MSTIYRSSNNSITITCRTNNLVLDKIIFTVIVPMTCLKTKVKDIVGDIFDIYHYYGDNSIVHRHVENRHLFVADNRITNIYTFDVVANIDNCVIKQGCLICSFNIRIKYNVEADFYTMLDTDSVLPFI